MIEKLRIGFIITLFLMGIIFLIIPAIQDNQKRKKITSEKINRFIEESKEVYLNNIQKILEEDYVTYADPNFLNRNSKYKNILLLKDNNTNTYYRIESYDTRVDANAGGDIKDKVYLVINPQDSKGAGTQQNPIVALRYYQKPTSSAYYINDERYILGVREYLTYKDYNPRGKNTDIIIAIIAFVIIVGIFITSNVPAKYKGGN